MRLIDADTLAKNMLEAYRLYGAEYMRKNYMKFIYDAPTIDIAATIHAAKCDEFRREA